jgi:hypothetical protein
LHPEEWDLGYQWYLDHLAAPENERLPILTKTNTDARQSSYRLTEEERKERTERERARLVIRERANGDDWRRRRLPRILWPRTLLTRASSRKKMTKRGNADTHFPRSRKSHRLATEA